MKKIITQVKEKIKRKKPKTQEQIEKEREEFFNSDDYIIQSTIFHFKNPDNGYRTKSS